MKKTIITVTLATAVAAFGFATFSACSIAGSGEALTGSMTIVLDSQEEGKEATEYTVDLTAYTTKDRVDDVIDDLADKKTFFYEGYNGAYGMFYTAMGYPVYHDVKEGEGYYVNEYVLQQDAAAGKYLYIYTSVVTDQDTSSYKKTTEYKGTSVTSAAVGASSMHLEDGAVIYFTYIIY